MNVFPPVSPSLYSECGSVSRSQGTLSYLQSLSLTAIVAPCTTETHTPLPLATVKSCTCTDRIKKKETRNKHSLLDGPSELSFV